MNKMPIRRHINLVIDVFNVGGVILALNKRVPNSTSSANVAAGRLGTILGVGYAIYLIASKPRSYWYYYLKQY